MTQKQLAAFRRENADMETILRQQRHDRETRAALVVLEGGRKAEHVRQADVPETDEEQKSLESSEKSAKANLYDNLLVFKRIHL